jgi:hypothetical protein
MRTGQQLPLQPAAGARTSGTHEVSGATAEAVKAILASLYCRSRFRIELHESDAVAYRG